MMVTMKRRKRNVRNKRAASVDDPFYRLPGELFLSILTRIPDLKSLCQYSLVSKHFASVISQIRFVSVTFLTSGTHVSDSFRNMFKLLRKLDSTTPDQIPIILDSLSLQKLHLPVFLKSFKDLESVHLEYTTHPKDSDDPSFPKWKVEFVNSRSNKIKSFLALLPEDEDEQENENEDEEDITDEFKRSLVKYCLLKSYWFFVEWLCLICMLVKSHASLQSITITDSEKRAKLVMGNEQLVKLRRSVVKELWRKFPRRFAKFLFVPIVHLPLSGGLVMRNSALVIISPAADSRLIAESAEERIASGYEEEDGGKLIDEVIIEAYKNEDYTF